MTLMEAARLMGYLPGEVVWSENEADSWRLLGNTWPVFVVAQLLKPMVADLGGPAWMGALEWTKTDYVRRLFMAVDE